MDTNHSEIRRRDFRNILDVYIKDDMVLFCSRSSISDNISPCLPPPPTVCPCKCFFCVSGERFSGYGLGVKAVPRASPLGKKWSLNLALGTRDLLMHVVYDFYPTDSRENNGHGTGPRQFGFDVADRPTVPGSRARQSHVHRALKMKHSKIL